MSGTSPTGGWNPLSSIIPRWSFGAASPTAEAERPEDDNTEAEGFVEIASNRSDSKFVTMTEEQYSTLWDNFRKTMAKVAQLEKQITAQSESFERQLAESRSSDGRLIEELRQSAAQEKEKSDSNIQGLKEKVDEQTTKINNMEKSKRESDSIILTLSQKVEKQAAENLETLKELAELKKESGSKILELSQKVEEQAAENLKILAQVSSLKDQIQDLEKTIKVNEETIEKLKLDVIEKQRTIDGLKKDIDGFEQKIARLEDQLDAADKTISGLVKELSDTQRDLQTAKDKIATLEQEKTQITQEKQKTEQNLLDIINTVQKVVSLSFWALLFRSAKKMPQPTLPMMELIKQGKVVVTSKTLKRWLEKNRKPLRIESQKRCSELQRLELREQRLSDRIEELECSEDLTDLQHEEIREMRGLLATLAQQIIDKRKEADEAKQLSDDCESYFKSRPSDGIELSPLGSVPSVAVDSQVLDSSIAVDLP